MNPAPSGAGATPMSRDTPSEAAQDALLHAAQEKYILEGHTPVRAPDFLAWAQWYATADLRVAQTEVAMIAHWLQQQDDVLLYDPDGEGKHRAHATTALERLLHTYGPASASAEWFAKPCQLPGMELGQAEA